MGRLMKKAVSFVLTLVMVASLFYGVDLSVSAATGYDNGYAGGRYGNSSSTVYAYGLDVSSWQGYNLDFNSIKRAGYDYVILRCGTTYGKDSCFETNYSKAKAAGMDVGVYYYSYALNTSQALTDANNCLTWISGKKFEYPIYFDYEDPSQDYLSNQTAKNICLTFMDKIASKGYLAGMYTGLYKSQSLPTNEICSKYEFWVAAYYYDGLYKPTRSGTTFAHISGMYQYTSTNYVNGVGPLDTNVCYKDYPTIVKTYGFNGYTASISAGNSGNTSAGTSTNTTSVHSRHFYPKCASGYTSLYPAFQSLGISTDWELHKQIAATNGIVGFTGTVAQNTHLLNLLKEGLLLKPAGALSYFPQCGSSYTSLYPAFNSLGISTDWEYHKQIAYTNGINGFTGTAAQNTQLLNLLKKGVLLKPVSYFPQCGSSYTSLYPAFQSLGISCDWEYHKRIAAVNRIDNFTGTAAQNTELLNLLKQGRLIKP